MPGFSHDGKQRVRWWNRNDCNGETAGAMAVAGWPCRIASTSRPARISAIGSIFVPLCRWDIAPIPNIQPMD